MFEPRIKMDDLDGLGINRERRNIVVNCHLNGLVTDHAIFEYELLIRHKAVNRHSKAKLEKLPIPDNIQRISGQHWVFKWNDIPLDRGDRFLMKYKVDVHGDNALKVPGRFDEDGWAELWL